MIKYLTPNPIQLESRLGPVGSIHPFDIWQFRESREAAIKGVATIASLSYGNEASKNPHKLFSTIVEKGHLSCLEFVPVPTFSAHGCVDLPEASLRHNMVIIEESEWNDYYWGDNVVDMGRMSHPATGFLVECPIFVARQWMRHRAFSYLELSRRYVQLKKIIAEYYGNDYGLLGLLTCARRELAEVEYMMRLKAGQPPELARKCLPMEMMTKFYVAGYNTEWKSSFLKLRDDVHAQPEIRVFAENIREVINGL